MNTIRTISPVAALRGSLWLAEVCRDTGVDPVAISWQGFTRPQHSVQVRNVDDLARLGDRLGLDPIVSNGKIAYRQAEWADFEVRVFCGVEA